MRSTRAIGLTVGLLALLQCKSDSSLAPLVLIRPRIDSLRIYSVMPGPRDTANLSGRIDSGIVWVTARLTDPSIHLDRYKGIPVDVTVSEGDTS